MATQKPTKRTATSGQGFTDEERAAMRERQREMRAAARRDPATERVDGERELLAKLAELGEPDRSMGERVHAIVSASAPDLVPRTWYGMPAWAREGKVVCFFQPAAKFKARYSTLGFNDGAQLDDGPMWPTSFALIELTAESEARIAELVRKAAG